MRVRSPQHQFRVVVRATDGAEWATHWDDDEVWARRMRDEYALRGEDLYVGSLEGSPREGRVFVVQSRTVAYGEPRDVGTAKVARPRQLDASTAAERQ